MDIEEKIYRAETCQTPIGESGDYNYWIELVTPNFNLQCYDQNIDIEEVEELAEMLNKVKTMEQVIKEVLEFMDVNCIPNIEWVKNRLLESVKYPFK